MAKRLYSSESKRVKLYRAQAYRRQNGYCFWCKAHVPRDEATADHLYERKNGGVTTPGNIVMAFQPCNNGRSNPPPEHHDHIKAWRRLRWKEMNIEVHADSIGA